MQKKSLISIISIGTLLEWAEYTFYGYMALPLSALFFPESSSQIAVLKTFGIFAMGYFMRPLGAIFFGHIGDKLGRKPALMTSLFLMGIATFCIGCLPTYATWGVFAPMLLLILRMFQGIAISGEYNGAGIFLIEKIGSKYPAVAGSWISASAAGGMVVGGIAALLTTLPFAPDYAWRIPFLLGGISCFIGLVLRNQVSESLPNSIPDKMPLLQVLSQYKKSLLFTAAIAAFTGIFVYIGNVYIIVFLKQQVNLVTHHATLFAIFGEIIVMLAIPVMAFIADCTDAYRQYRAGLLLIALSAPLIFLLCTTGNYLLITLAMILYGVLNGMVCGPMVKMMYDQFPPHLRYTGISFAWSVSAALFSGTAPMVAQYLMTQFQWILGPPFYVSLAAIVTYVIVTAHGFSARQRASSNPSTLKLRRGLS